MRVWKIRTLVQKENLRSRHNKQTNKLHSKMPTFDRDALILALKVSSTAALGLYAGSSVYINAVEVPAALDYDAEHGLMCWQRNFARASRFCVSFYCSSALLPTQRLILMAQLILQFVFFYTILL